MSLYIHLDLSWLKPTNWLSDCGESAPPRLGVEPRVEPTVEHFRSQLYWGGQIVVTFSIVQVQRSPFTFYPVLWSLVHYFIKVQSEVPCVWRVCRAGGGRGRSGRVSLPRPLQRCWTRAAAACCWSSLVLQCCSAGLQLPLNFWKPAAILTSSSSKYPPQFCNPTADSLSTNVPILFWTWKLSNST